MVSAIIPGFIMTGYEDYQFERGWWVGGKEPWSYEQFDEPMWWNDWPDEYFSSIAWTY